MTPDTTTLRMLLRQVKIIECQPDFSVDDGPPMWSVAREVLNDVVPIPDRRAPLSSQYILEVERKLFEMDNPEQFKKLTDLVGSMERERKQPTVQMGWLPAVALAITAAIGAIAAVSLWMTVTSFSVEALTWFTVTAIAEIQLVRTYLSILKVQRRAGSSSDISVYSSFDPDIDLKMDIEP